MSTYITRGAVAALLLSIVAFPVAVRGQEPSPPRAHGLHISVLGGGYGVGYEDHREGGGGSVGLRIGFGLSNRVTLYAGVGGASVSEGDGLAELPPGDDYNAYFLDLGVRVRFRTGQAIIPFVEVGGSGVGLSFHNQADEKVAYSGPSAHLGGGAMYFVTPWMSMEAGASFTIGELQEREVAGAAEDVGIRVAGMRVQVGVSLYPFR